MNVLAMVVGLCTFLFCIFRYGDGGSFRSGMNSMFCTYWATLSIISASSTDVFNLIISVGMLGFSFYVLELERGRIDKSGE